MSICLITNRNFLLHLIIFNICAIHKLYQPAGEHSHGFIESALDHSDGSDGEGFMFEWDLADIFNWCYLKWFDWLQTSSLCLRLLFQFGWLSIRYLVFHKDITFHNSHLLCNPLDAVFRGELAKVKINVNLLQHFRHLTSWAGFVNLVRFKIGPIKHRILLWRGQAGRP